MAAREHRAGGTGKGAMKIGLIGLGKIGGALAANLLRGGFALAVHDLRRAAAEPLLAAGAVWAESPRAATAGADRVITSLPSPAIVAEVMEGADGVLEGLGPGAVWIEMSTTDADEVRRLAGRARERGATTIDAPVTCGVERARTAEITLLVGGDAADLEACRPVFEAVSSTAVHIGPLGSASVAKVITNLLAFVHLWAIGEGLMLGKRAGIDVATLLAAIKVSYGNSFVAENEAKFILDGSYNVEFTLALAAKDLDLVHALGKRLGVPLELGGLVERIFARARAQYGDDAQSTQVVKLLEDTVGATLRGRA